MFKFVSTTGRTSKTHCALCGKGRMRGNLVSHSKHRTKRLFKPNLQAYWVMEGTRKVRRMFCVKCLRRIKSLSQQSKSKIQSAPVASSILVSPIQ